MTTTTATRPLRAGLRALGQRIRGAADAITLGPTHGHTTALFQKALYLWVLGYTAILLPAAASFWAPDAYTLTPPGAASSASGWLQRGLSLLHDPAFAPYWRWFLLGQVFFAGLGLLGRFPRLAALGLFFCAKNLNSKAWIISNGGINFLEILLLLNLFLHPAPAVTPRPTFASMLNNVLANVAFLAARLQLCIIYATSGLAKATGKLWAHGVGVYYVLNTDEFSCPLGRHLASSDVLVTLGSFGTIAFMLSFPTLVWFRQTRWLVLLAGVGLHLQIALLMGLVDFAAIMLVSYTLFLPDSLSKRILDALRPARAPDAREALPLCSPVR